MVNPRKAFNYFRSTFPLRRSSQNWWAFDCPYCIGGDGERKMAVHFEYEMVKCWKCGYRERLIDFVKEWEDLSYVGAREKINGYDEAGVDADVIDAVHVMKVEGLSLPTGYTPLLDGTGVLGVRARNYLAGRGFDLEMLDKLGVGYCNDRDPEEKLDYFGYIIIPFKTKGKLQYYIGRDFIGNYLRYKNPDKDLVGVGKTELVFNEDALDYRKECFVTEGWADALTMGDNGISTQGWSLSVTQRNKMFKSRCRRFVFLPDKGFYLQALQTAQPFLDHKEVFVVNMDDVDHGKDVNDLGRDFVLSLYHRTEQLTFETVINSLS
jgi:DNA primase